MDTLTWNNFAPYLNKHVRIQQLRIYKQHTKTVQLGIRSKYHTKTGQSHMTSKINTVRLDNCTPYTNRHAPLPEQRCIKTNDRTILTSEPDEQAPEPILPGKKLPARTARHTVSMPRALKKIHSCPYVNRLEVGN